jgi:photosystem II stability/assembly factor-like uncharacterized protein
MIRRLGTFVAVATIAAVVVGAISTAPSAAHTPHDDIFDVVPSPDYARDGTFFVISRGFLFKSSDRGATLTRLVRGLDNNTQALSALSVAPNDPATVYVSSPGDGVYASTDGGSSWHRTNSGIGTRDIAATWVSPTSPRTVLATGTDSGVWKSSDGGASWTSIGQFDAPVRAIAFAPGNAAQLLAGDERGSLHLSRDGGDTWIPVPVEGAGAIRSIAFAPDDPSARTWFLGTTNHGVFVTTDGGATFERRNRGLADRSISSVALSSEYPSDHRVWVSTASDGVYASSDSGETWERRSVGLTTNSQNDLAGFEDRPDFSVVRVAAPAASGGAPTLFLAGFDGLFRSTDGAKTWHEVETLSSSILVGLTLSPNYAADQTLAVTTYINGAFSSRDGGESWTAIDTGLQEPAYSGFADRVARLFGIALSPDFAHDQTMFSSSASSFLVSTTSGRHWRRVVPPDAGGVHQPRQFSVVVSPEFARDRTVLYGDATTARVFRSTDGGATFARFAEIPSSIRMLSISPDFATDGVLYAGTVSGVFRSEDRGSHWVPLGLEGHAVINLAVSRSGQTVLAGTPHGLYASVDSGRTWAPKSIDGADANESIEAVAMTPSFEADQTVLVSVQGRGLFRSVDGGASFAPVASGLLADQQVFGNFSKPTASALVFSPDYGTDTTVFGYSGTNLLKSIDGGASWEYLAIPRYSHALPRTAAAAVEPGGRPSREVAALAILVVGAVLVASIVAAIAVRRRIGTARVGASSR